MRYAGIALAALVGCGDNITVTIDAPPAASFAIVGHTDLGARGMNAALAIAGDTAYVGSRIDNQPIAIVDLTDPSAPAVVGAIDVAQHEGLPTMSSRELRVAGDLLVVLNLRCDPALHGCANTGGEPENLRLFDIHDRHAPVEVATYPVHGVDGFHARSPHEFFLWRDPADHARVLILLAAPAGPPSFEVIDVTTPSTPVTVVQWDAVKDGGLDGTGADNILHSVSASPDGKVGYFSHQQGGLVLVDLSQVISGTATPALSMITPPASALHWLPASIGPHSAVLVPGRELLVVTEEIYPPPYGTGCPWGHLRTVDISDPAAPSISGELALAENAPEFCAHAAAKATFTAHNATVTHDLALVSWYGAGLEAVDLADPAHPSRLAELRPEPLAAVTHEDPGLLGAPVEMWSYPIVQDGLIYVVDVRNGLYVLRYDGPHAEEVSGLSFAEGNSNL